MNLKQQLAEAKQTGVLWIIGETASPINQGPAATYMTACEIAEECGYVVWWQTRGKSFAIAGGDITGYVSCIWDRSSEIERLDHWTQKSFWVEVDNAAS